MAVNVPRVQTASREVNQLQQNIIQALVPVINALLAGPTRYTTAGMPAATSEWQFIRVKDPGQPEQLMLSMQTSTGGYAWAVVVQAPL